MVLWRALALGQKCSKVTSSFSVLTSKEWIMQLEMFTTSSGNSMLLTLKCFINYVVSSRILNSYCVSCITSFSHTCTKMFLFLSIYLNTKCVVLKKNCEVGS